MDIVEWGKLTWPQAELAVKAMPACLVPLGAIEAHGPHLALDVDNGIVEEKCRRICSSTGVIKMPLMPYGVVYSLYDYPGSLTLSFDLMAQLCAELVQSLQDRGFRAVFFISHHGGNADAVKKTIRGCSTAYPGMTLAFLHAPAALRAAQKKVCTAPLTDPSRAHADELETSQALACCPSSVLMDRAIRHYPELPADFGAVPYRWSAVSPFGVMGDATAGTREKGEALIDAEVNAMIETVRYILATHMGIGGN